MTEFLHTFYRVFTYSNRGDAGFAGFSRLLTPMQACILFFDALLQKIKIIIKIREYLKYVIRYVTINHSFFNNKPKKACINSQKACKVCNNREELCKKPAITMLKVCFYMLFTGFLHTFYTLLQYKQHNLWGCFNAN